MTPERALWEAVATVSVPSLVIWGVLLYVVSGNARPDEWPVYIVLVALPLPLIYPIYKRYLRGSNTKVENPRVLFFAASSSAVLGTAYVISALFRHHDNSDLVSHLIMGIAWLGIGIEKLRPGVKARTNLAR